MAEIAIVDDEEILVESLCIHLGRQGYTVRPFLTASAFRDYLRGHEPDLVFLDLKLPDGNGLDLLGPVMDLDKSIRVVVVTAHGTMESAIQALKSGAADYVNKPFDLQEIDILVEKMLNERLLLKEVEHRRERDYGAKRIETFIGTSPPVVQLLDRVKRLAGIDNTTVLIQGETGTGKSLLAKAIHNLSARAARQFIEINCAAMPETLLESELFGYERGAFTDARQRKIGLVELGNGGTLFLDEIGELPLTIQAKLLNFLESRSFRRIGGAAEIRVDVLVIAASNADLDAAVREGRFRRDLFYRLNVVPLVVAPLRERGEDVLALAEAYLDLYMRKFGRLKMTLGEDAKRAFLAYDWPGNVRELKNVIEMLVILSEGDRIDATQVPAEIRCGSGGRREGAVPCGAASLNLEERIRQCEREAIREALDRARGVKTDAARLLGVSRFALLRKLKMLGEDEQD